MNIQYVEQRGKSRALEGKRNRQRVKDWFEEHPFSTQKECGADLKLSLVTVSKHLKSIRGQ